MAKLIVFGVLAIIEVVSELWALWEYWRMASTARERRTGAPIPMRDEPPGVATETAPSDNGTNRPLKR
jgi:hypothetical protein